MLKDSKKLFFFSLHSNDSGIRACEGSRERGHCEVGKCQDEKKENEDGAKGKN